MPYGTAICDTPSTALSLNPELKELQSCSAIKLARVARALIVAYVDLLACLRTKLVPFAAAMQTKKGNCRGSTAPSELKQIRAKASRTLHLSGYSYKAGQGRCVGWPLEETYILGLASTQ